MTASELSTADPSRVTFASVRASALGTGHRRLDAETYLTEGYSWRECIQSCKAGWDTVLDLAKVWAPNRLKGVLVKPSEGVPFLVASQVFDMRPTVRKWVSPKHTPNLESRKVERGWILMTISGDVGNAIVSYGPHLGPILTHDLLRVVPNDPKDLGRLYLFFRSRAGRAMCRSSKYGSVVKHIEPEHVQEIPVPRMDSACRDRFLAQVREIFSLRQEAWQTTEEAYRLYADNLGIALPVPDNESRFTVRASSLFRRGRRLDASHYDPYAGAVEATLRMTGRPIETLGEATDRIFQVKRFKHIYTEAGIPYLDAEDIFKVHAELVKFIPKAAKKDAADYFVNREWVLMMTSGQVYGMNGSVLLSDAWHEEKIVSNHITRIVPDLSRGKPPAGYLAVALSHPVLGRPLVVRLAFGTEVPEIAPTDLEDIPLPRLPETKERKIASLAEKARDLWAQARTKETESVAAFEREVETILRRAS